MDRGAIIGYTREHLCIGNEEDVATASRIWPVFVLQRSIFELFSVEELLETSFIHNVSGFFIRIYADNRFTLLQIQRIAYDRNTSYIVGKGQLEKVTNIFIVCNSVYMNDPTPINVPLTIVSDRAPDTHELAFNWSEIDLESLIQKRKDLIDRVLPKLSSLDFKFSPYCSLFQYLPGLDAVDNHTRAQESFKSNFLEKKSPRKSGRPRKHVSREHVVQLITEGHTIKEIAGLLDPPVSKKTLINRLAEYDLLQLAESSDISIAKKRTTSSPQVPTLDILAKNQSINSSMMLELNSFTQPDLQNDAVSDISPFGSWQ
ncbi:hypothetical protein PCE1_001580 [Barthelona sp. PCE]